MNSATGEGPAARDAPGGTAVARPATEARFRTILNAIPQIVWTATPDGHHDFYNDRWYEFTGAARGRSNGETWNALFHPDDQALAAARWQHSLATGAPYEIEFRWRHHTGVYRWTLGRALPARAPDGQIERWFGTCTDIHDLKTAEAQRELIASELSHRIKNIFAVVASLITLSARHVPAARGFAYAIRARVDALARAHDYIRPHSPRSDPNHNGQTVRGLIRTLLAAYADGDQGPVVIEGADAPIGATAATSLALVIHELATNAMKYGALSLAAGRVSLESRLAGEQFVIVWREIGGPPVVQAPERHGFGSIMSERALSALGGARITHAWDVSGLVATIALAQSDLAR